MNQKTKILPEGWKEVELGGISILITKGTTPTTYGYKYRNEGIPFLKVENIVGGKIDFACNPRYIDEKTYNFLNRSKLKKNDVLFTIAGAIGRSAVVNIENKMNINQAIALIRLKEKISPEFISLLLSSRHIQNQIKSSVVQVAQANLSLTQLSKIKIPLPSLDVQKKIVSILEKAEKLKQQRAEADKLTQEYLQSVFYEMFMREEFEEVELGREDLFDIQSGGTPSKTNKEYWDNGKIPWIGSTACKDKLITHAEKKITNEGLKSSSARMFPKDTVLIALVGATIGKTGLLDFECSTNQNIAGIIIKGNDFNHLFLFYAMQTLYPKFISLSSESFKMANLSFIRTLKIPFPPITLQQKFAAIVEKVEAMKEQQKKSKLEIDNLFNALMQRAFKGELVK